MIKDGRLLIAAGVISVTATLFFAGYIANMFGQLKSTGTYDLPESYLGLFQLLLGSSVAILTLGGIQFSKSSSEKAIEKEEPKLPAVIDTIDIVDVSEVKYDSFEVKESNHEHVNF